MAQAFLLRRSNVERIAFDPETGAVVGAPKPITRGSLSVGRPDPSPDGEWIAMAVTEGQEDILVARTDGSETRRLTDDAFKDRIPRWSPVDDRIAFYSNRGGSYDVWLVRSDGSGLRRLTNTPDGICIEPLWSPDGRRVAYVDGERLALGIADLAGGGEPSITHEKIDLGGLFFLPHSWALGDRLVGTVQGGDGVRVGLTILELGGGSLERLRDSGDLPVWLDARRLLFIEAGAVHLLDLETRESHSVLSFEPPASVVHFALSADRRSLYFTRLVEESDLWLIELE